MGEELGEDAGRLVRRVFWKISFEEFFTDFWKNGPDGSFRIFQPILDHRFPLTTGNSFGFRAEAEGEQDEPEPSPLHDVAGALQAALDASVLDASAQSVDENAQVGEALLRSRMNSDRLVPGYVVLLEVSRTIERLRRELLAIRCVELESGAKMMVRPDQQSAVRQRIATAESFSSEKIMQSIDGVQLYPRHILVSPENEDRVQQVVDSIGEQVQVKKRRLRIKTPPVFGSQVATVKSTFICLGIPSSTTSGSTSKQAASA